MTYPTGKVEIDQMTELLNADRTIPTVPHYLSLAQLVKVSRSWVSHVNPEDWKDQPSDRRWYCRLEFNDSYEVLLSGWDHDQTNSFHDHGGSSGAVTVIQGALLEQQISLKTTFSVNRVAKPGDSFTFGPHDIHEVTNASSDVPSLSIHVYSPPLSTMTYYDVTDDAVVPQERIAVDGPEPGALDLTRLRTN